MLEWPSECYVCSRAGTGKRVELLFTLFNPRRRNSVLEMARAMADPTYLLPSAVALRAPFFMKKVGSLESLNFEGVEKLSEGDDYAGYFLLSQYPIYPYYGWLHVMRD